MPHVSEPRDPDVERIARIEAVPAILRVVGEVTGLRLSLVARVTDVIWKACAVHDRMAFGLDPGAQLEVATTLCSEVRDARAPIVIDHASIDPIYCAHPTPRMYNFESYVSVPIFLQDGAYFGTLCALDTEPHSLKDSKTLPMMTLFAELISLQLQADERQRRAEVDLRDAQQTAELREQFIAVLGHDVRTPLSAILSGLDLLRRRVGDAERGIVDRIHGSCLRISRLVDDVLDFARGRLGGGIALNKGEVTDLHAVITQVVEEARSAHPNRAIRLCVPEVATLHGDRDRLGQLLANLVANAVEHGDPREPVDVIVEMLQGALVLSVSNRGEPIPEQLLPSLFQPYRRGASGRPRVGLGLGLYIVSEIAKSHGGRVEVRSSHTEGTTFTCTLPLAASLGR